MVAVHQNTSEAGRTGFSVLIDGDMRRGTMNNPTMVILLLASTRSVGVHLRGPRAVGGLRVDHPQVTVRTIYDEHVFKLGFV